jgi:hypothetical protein
MATVSYTNEQLGEALEEMAICDPDAADMCEDVLEVLERRKNPAAVEQWIAKVVKASAGPRSTAAIKAQAQTILDEADQPSAPPARQRGVVSAPKERGRDRGRDRTPVVSDGAARRIMGLAAFLFGLPLWIVGAHYTLDGWTLIINIVTDLVRLGHTLPLASGIWAALLIPVGIVYSIGERRYVPWRKVSGRWTYLGGGILLVWLLVNGSDLVSTYMGIATPPPNAWPITIWMATTLWAKLGWIVVVTYLPETLLLLGWRWAFR